MTDVNGDGVAGGDPWLGAPVYRREFLRRMAIIGGGVLAGGTLLSGLACGAETPTQPCLPTQPRLLRQW